jgi:iron(III) transport system permease protein
LGFLVQEAFFRGTDPLYTEAPELVWGLFRTTLQVSAVAVGVSLLIGGFAAWAVSYREFPGRKVFSVLLCLPFAIPPYLLAGLYRQFEHAGRIPLPSFENTIGAGFLLGLSLYPWVYLPLKAQLSQQSATYAEVGKMLGLSAWERFQSIHLGLLMPTLGIAALLVTMEVISDFGTVNLLGVKTLSVGIHDAMFSMGHKDWAAQLSVLGLLIPAIGVALFAVAYHKRKVYQPPNRGQTPERLRPGMAGQLAILLGLMLPLTAGFLLPVWVLARWAVQNFGRIPLRDLPGQAGDTLLVTAWVAGFTLFIALGLNLCIRLRREMRAWSGLAVLINLNYALPSVMLAIALLFLSAGLPDAVVDILLSDSISLLVLAGCLGYLAFPYFTIRSGLDAVSPRLDDLATLFRFGPVEKVLKIYLPLTRRAVASGLLLVVVNMAKELPMSQVLQPFGYQSLSMRLFTFAGLDLLEEAAIYALCMIGLVIYPVVTLDRLISKREGEAC